jgi:hypothetical protein
MNMARDKKPPKRRGEPYGYDAPGYPRNQRYARPDGYDPYRVPHGQGHPASARVKDDRNHPSVTYERYGDDARDADAPATPPLPRGLKSERQKDT